jgi:hypothetical protein
MVICFCQADDIFSTSGHNRRFMKNQLIKPQESSRVVRSLIAACTLFAASVPASAIVVGSFVDNGNGTFTYSYEIDNSGGAFPVAAWSLEFGFTTPDWDSLDTLSGGDVSVPNANWFAIGGNLPGGEAIQDFLTLSSVAEVPIGQTLLGFSFTSEFAPGLVDFTEFSAGGDFNIGSTIGPVPASAVPEAGSGMEGIAFAALVAFAAVARSRNVN